MSDVRVTMRALLDASGGVDAAIEQANEANVGGLGDESSVYGHERLARSVAGFGDAWKYGVSVLLRDATGLRDALSDSAKTYAETEDVNVDRLTSPGE